MSRTQREEKNISGLTTAQAEKRLAKYGENRLSENKKTHPAQIFAGQFKDFMVLILLGATVVSVIMGEAIEAITIVVIVLVNALLGFVQEYKTEKTLEALKNMSAPHAKVMRDGVLIEIASSEVVPEDLLVLSAGDRVPADAKILEAVSLYSDESMLSGESHPVLKTEWQEPSDKEIQAGMVYMGTTITQGRCKAKVQTTGMGTQMGQIAAMLGSIENEKTPLQKKLGVLGKYIGIACLAICFLVTITGILRGEDLFEMLLLGISLAVAAIPEGLPAVVTIALALAVSRMVKRGALIRKLHAVETMGCVQVICTDKTGTLTENKMTVQQISSLSKNYFIQNGAVFDSSGVLQENTQELKKMMQIAVLCNNTTLPADDQNAVSADPTELALLHMAHAANYLPERLQREFSRTHEIPFDSSRKRMSVVVRGRQGDYSLFCKGATDYLLDFCDFYLDGEQVKLLTPSARKTIQNLNETMAEKALRVISFAYKTGVNPAEEREDSLVFAGMCGMIDPPRKEAFAAVETCKKAGIQTVMITGDHLATATAIARELKILEPGAKVLTGKELDGLSEPELRKQLSSVRVFARVTPAHKLRIVKAFKQKGKVVAMTGDGVNDALAIKEADIGVAMGNATDVTKEASSVVLLDNSFATLVHAIEEGRAIYKNIRKFIRYLLSCNIGEIVTMFFGMLMCMPVVLLPIQILIVNLVTDGLPAIALGLEPPEKDSMQKPPRKKTTGFSRVGCFRPSCFEDFSLALQPLRCLCIFFTAPGT